MPTPTTCLPHIGRHLLSGRQCLHMPAFLGSAATSRTQQRSLRMMPPVQMGRRSAKIAGRKGAQDSRKAKLWGKIAKQVLQAAKQGGVSPESNARLKEVLYQAKQLAIPKDIIDRNLKKAADKDQADFSEIVYEAYGPSATGFVIECLTDNPNRSANAVRAAVSKSGGKMAEKGSVLFNFSRKGQVFVPEPDAEDKVFEAAMDGGAEDIVPATSEDVRTGFKVITAAEDFAAVREYLTEQQLPVDEDQSGLVYLPLAEKEVDEEALSSNESMLEKLLAIDDCDAVYSNCAGIEA